MKVAIPSRNGQVDEHFGHCAYYTIFTIENNKVIKEDIFESPEGCGCKSNIAPLLAQNGVKTMLAGNMGMGALNILNYHGIEVFRSCSGNVQDVISGYLSGNVSDSGKGCDSHEGCDNH
ncbi:MAG: dinitrogenase iron-molybdenum cofactor biosynthesis protein [Bacteroidetes bacterium RIFOXYA12_FULL_35_11]|nr:MAG: dinitrogenase iron-molybdenum cofactor biosynthesis protein [Bacteroidetes bacterium GWF2_35_48]OFY72603.1 MAG: dinitrogenase iron-molybdenum cofactor biosynthesis protein [Bacteroidetes bacterium RIFOXYA12_FULL_35_11]HBX52544.1 dinitrogenase iron-molybdenum cofactor biosynthesis protein [Bacteroidales bacterium]